ncbi:MAG: hypothetical protein IJ659_04205 [Alloprevotella sp.]|nr:hypothetical protein [Alloprevotella sp.]
MKKTLLLCTIILMSLGASAQTAGKVTFQGALALLQYIAGNVEPAPKDIVEASGLRLVYYSCYDEGEFDSSAFYYTRNANISGEYDEENMCRKAEKTGGHACILGVECATSSGGEIRFSTKEDYDRFFREAVAYGLQQDREGVEYNMPHYFIDRKQLNPGRIEQVPNQELFAAYMDEEAEAKYNPQFMLVPKGKTGDGWYTYHIGIDF